MKGGISHRGQRTVTAIIATCIAGMTKSAAAAQPCREQHAAKCDPTAMKGADGRRVHSAIVRGGNSGADARASRRYSRTPWIARQGACRPATTQQDIRCRTGERAAPTGLEHCAHVPKTSGSAQEAAPP